jgi:integrase
LKLLRCIFNWAIKARIAAEHAKMDAPVYAIASTPFISIGNEAFIKLDAETPRTFRFKPDDEQRLLAAADSYMHDLFIAMLDLCTRPGELLKMQVKHVDLKAKEVDLAWRSTKTRRGRVLLLTSRVSAVLEMRLLGPDGKPRDADEFVFGKRPVKR